jgi:hypothetical protein
VQLALALTLLASAAVTGCGSGAPRRLHAYDHRNIRHNHPDRDL